jgi:hypothetical protein
LFPGTPSIAAPKRPSMRPIYPRRKRPTDGVGFAPYPVVVPGGFCLPVPTLGGSSGIVLQLYPKCLLCVMDKPKTLKILGDFYGIGKSKGHRPNDYFA